MHAHAHMCMQTISHTLTHTNILHVGLDSCTQSVQAGLPEGPYAHEPARSPVLQVNAEQPFNAEPPLPLLVNDHLTPNHLFFVRNHLPVPEIDPDTYVLEIIVPDATVGVVHVCLHDVCEYMLVCMHACVRVCVWLCIFVSCVCVSVCVLVRLGSIDITNVLEPPCGGGEGGIHEWWAMARAYTQRARASWCVSVGYIVWECLCVCV